jgi:hypothetical protein
MTQSRPIACEVRTACRRQATESNLIVRGLVKNELLPKNMSRGAGGLGRVFLMVLEREDRVEREEREVRRCKFERLTKVTRATKVSYSHNSSQSSQLLDIGL